ncbi:unnamed protein product, partial [Polarella glacialis]
DLDGPGAEHVPFALTTAGYGFVNLLLCIVQGLHGSIQGDSKALLEYVLTGVMARSRNRSGGWLAAALCVSGLDRPGLHEALGSTGDSPAHGSCLRSSAGRKPIPPPGR